MNRGRVAPLALLLTTAACVAPLQPPPVADKVPPAEVVQPVRASAPVPAPAFAAAHAPLFTFDGQLTQGGWIRGRVPEGTISARLGDVPLSVNAQGNFFAAFDRDAGSSAKLSATLVDGRVIESPLSITPRAWNIEHINAARTPGGASDDFMTRRRPELAAIWDARQERTSSEGWRQDFIWPVTGRISGRFGSQRVYRGEPGAYHSGLDIATGTSGTPYVAPADGVVVLAVQGYSLEGNLLIIDHGQGLNSAFLHSSRLYVRQGERVRQGQHIGDIGSSGRATGPHLHWSIKWHEARLDPLLFLPPMP